MSDADLLDLYRQGSREAFAELVRRHIDWVYGLAKRRVRDTHLAEDIVQASFTILARKAPILGAHQPLSAWLFKVVALASMAALRTESRRRHHETEAAKMRIITQSSDAESSHTLADELDELVGRLSRSDRQAVLLRFYEQKSFVDVAASLGITEVAARRRVARAMDRLRDIVSRRGMTVPAATLAGTLAAQMALPAPAALAASVSTLPLTLSTAAAPATILVNTLVTAMKWTKIKYAVSVSLLALFVAGTGAISLLHFRSSNAHQAVSKKIVDPATAPATQPGDPARGLELYNAAKKYEDWVHDVTSFYVRFEARWDQTPQRIARIIEDRKVPRRIPVHRPAVDSELWPSHTESLSLGFDKNCLAHRQESYGLRLMHYLWNGQGGISYSKTSGEPQAYRSFELVPPQSLLDPFTGISWLRVTRRTDPHRFWWDQYRINPQSIEPSPQVAEWVGRANYQGQDCHIVDLRDGWTRLLISTGERPLAHGIITYASNRTADHALVARRVSEQLNMEINDPSQLANLRATLPPADSERLWSAYQRELLKQSHVLSAHYLLDYREVSPGRWFPMIQGYVLYDEPDETGNPVVRAWRTLTATEVQIDKPLPAELMEVPLQ